MVKKVFIIVGIVITLFCIGFVEEYNEKKESEQRQTYSSVCVRILNLNG